MILLLRKALLDACSCSSCFQSLSVNQVAFKKKNPDKHKASVFIRKVDLVKGCPGTFFHREEVKTEHKIAGLYERPRHLLVCKDSGGGEVARRGALYITGS